VSQRVSVYFGTGDHRTAQRHAAAANASNSATGCASTTTRFELSLGILLATLWNQRVRAGVPNDSQLEPHRALAQGD
jgi:hypothetical protein